MNTNPESLLEELFGSVSALAPETSVKLNPISTSSTELSKLIENNINGLLQKGELTPLEVTLLGSLLQTRRY